MNNRAREAWEQFGANDFVAALVDETYEGLLIDQLKELDADQLLKIWKLCSGKEKNWEVSGAAVNFKFSPVAAVWARLTVKEQSAVLESIK